MQRLRGPAGTAVPDGAESPARVGRGDRAEQTREWILTAAAEAFAAGGYLGVNLSDIVAKIGLTKGALYYFFPTKEALAREIVERHFAAWRDLSVATQAEVANRVDAVVEMSYRAARMFQGNPITRAGARLALEGNLVNIEFPLPFGGWVERVTAILTDGQARGEVAETVDARRAAEMIVVYFQGAQEVCRELDDRQDLIARLEYFWDFLAPVLRPKGDEGKPKT